MNILQVNTADSGGGADRVAWDLYDGLKKAGHQAWMAVDIKTCDDASIFKIPRARKKSTWAGARLIRLAKIILERFQSVPGSWRLARFLQLLGGGQDQLRHERGEEIFSYPGSHKIPYLTPGKPELLHLHNLHGYYFDLRMLPELSHQFPLMITLHDEWMLTGHCAYSQSCGRWRDSCGECPHLDVFPPLEADGTAFNLQRKKSIYTNSRLWVATPSMWLQKRMQESVLNPVSSRTIPNGIDLSVFRTTPKIAARKKLGLPANGTLLLFSANMSNKYKDFPTVAAALRLLSTDEALHLYAVGATKEVEDKVGDHTINFVPYVTEVEQMAAWYQAADIFLFATNADNHPLVIMEALACGTPVIATAVGGIPEQIKDLDEHGPEHATGILTPQGDPKAMADAIKRLLHSEENREQLGVNAAADAIHRFDRNRMLEEYVQWYKEILAEAKTA